MIKANDVLFLIGDFVTTNEALKDDIGKFWVVTKPSGESELVDICFEASITDMMLQAKGGLKTDEILAILKSKSEAEKLAQSLLDKQAK